MADVAALVFDIDSSQARGAAKDLADLNSAAIKAANSAASIGTTMRDTNGKFQEAIRLTANNTREIESYAQAYNPVLAAQIKFRNEVVRTASAVKAGAMDQKQRIEYLKNLKRELDGSASAERRASAAREAARREFLPMYAASKQYEETLERLNAALKDTHINENQHAAALSRLNSEYAASTVAAQRFGQSQQVARHHVANLSFQLNDIGMMMAMGQNPFMLMMQQGPQVAQIIGQMNQEGRKLGPTLSGAFKMFLNPTTAVTLALIGATAALGQWAMSAIGASSDAKKFADSLSDMESALSDISKFGKFDASTKRLNVSLDEIVSKYGSINEGVEKHINLVNQAAIATANLSKNNYMSLFTETFDTGWLTTRVDDVRIAFETTNDSARDLIRLMEEASKARGITAQREAAESLRDEVIRITGGVQSMTLEQLNFLNGLNAAIESLRQIEVQTGRASDNILESARQTAAWERNMAAVKAQIDAISRSLSAIGGFQLQAVSANMERRLLEAGVAAGKAAKQVEDFERAAEFMNRRKGIMAQFSGRYDDPGYATAIRMLNEEEAAARAASDAQFALGETRERLAEEERERRKAERGGASAAKAAERRAAAELKAAEKGFQNIRELLERESLFQVAEWEKRQKQLDAALAKDLLTRENYELMKQQLQQHYFGTEYQRKQVQYDMDLQQLRAALDAEMITRQQYAIMAANLHSQQVSQMGAADANIYSQHLSNLAGHFGEMNAIAGGGYDSLLKAQRVFGAASALISTYQGAAKALELPFPYNMAAMAKVLAAGMGMVNAIKSGGSSKGAGASSSAAVRQEPTRNVLVRMEGPDWMQDIAESVITQIYDQSKDGRVIISRDY